MNPIAAFLSTDGETEVSPLLKRGPHGQPPCFHDFMRHWERFPGNRTREQAIAECEQAWQRFWDETGRRNREIVDAEIAAHRAAKATAEEAQQPRREKHAFR